MVAIPHAFHIPSTLVFALAHIKANTCIRPPVLIYIEHVHLKYPDIMGDMKVFAVSTF
jgi:hypothetical protein